VVVKVLDGIIIKQYNIKVMTTFLTIRFYEGSYQYKSAEVIEHKTDSNLFTGILNELNHQYNHRPTAKDLWTVVIKDDEEIFRVIRSSKSQVSVWEMTTDTKYNFTPLEKYDLIFFIKDLK
jgi:hypothetical protein